MFAKLGRSTDNGDGVRTRLDLTGSVAEGLAGYRLQVHWHNTKGAFSVGDYSYGWFKPMANDLLAVWFGKFQVDDLRGKGQGARNFGDYSHATLGGEEDIFRRFEGSNNGLALISKPVSGLTIGFDVKNMASEDVAIWHHGNNGGGNTTAATSTTPNLKAGAQWSLFHLAAGYAIPNIGLARVGFLGADKDTHQNSWTGASARGIPYSSAKGGTRAETSAWTGFPTGHQIQAAFGLTAVPNLTLDFGFGLPIAYKVAADNEKFFVTTAGVYALNAKTGAIELGKTSTTYATYQDGGGKDTEFQAPFNLSLATGYVFGDFEARLRGDFWFGGSYKVGDADKQDLPVTLSLHLVPSYNIPNIGLVGVEFGLNAYGGVTAKNYPLTGKDEDLTGGIQNLGFGAWYQKSLAGGTFKVGLNYIVPLAPVGSFTGISDDVLDDLEDNNSPGIFTIPVYFDVSF